MGKLNDNKYVFTLLTALVKRAGGEVRLSEVEVMAVTTQDVVSLLYDKETKEIVLRAADNVFMVNPADDGYEN